MNTTLLLITAVIIASWLIALCFKDFRGRCADYVPEMFTDFYQMYKEDDTGNIFYKIFLVLFVFLIAYPIIILIIIVSPILCGFAEIYNFVNDLRRTRKKKDEPLTDWQIDQQERERKQKEMEEWRDSRIKAFHYEGKAPFHFDRDTYLYLENTYNESLNQCIERNLDVIDKVFKEYGFQFVYLPKWNPNRDNIRLANITDEQ